MGRHGGINILHQKSWHVWRMDNRLRVERDEQQHAAEEAEKRRAGEQAVFEKKLKQLRHRAAGEPEAPEVLLDERTSDASLVGSSSSSSAGLQQDNLDKRKVNEYKGVYGVTLSNLKQAEAHLDFTLKKTSKGKGKGKGREASENSKSGGLGSGPHINFFEDAEREQQHHMSEHEKQLRYTQANNEIVGKSKKALFSEFDEISSTVPWYLKPRQAERPPGAEDTNSKMVAGRKNVGPTPARRGRRQDGAEKQEALALRNASRSRSRTPPKRKKWTTSHGQVVLQVKPARESVHIKAALKDETEELQPTDIAKEFGIAQPLAYEIGSSDSDTAHSIVDPVLSTIGVVLCKKESGGDKKCKKDKKLKEDKKVKKERKARKQNLKMIELERLRQQRMERERTERARVVGLLPGAS